MLFQRNRRPRQPSKGLRGTPVATISISAIHLLPSPPLSCSLSLSFPPPRFVPLLLCRFVPVQSSTDRTNLYRRPIGTGSGSDSNSAFLGWRAWDNIGNKGREVVERGIKKHDFLGPIGQPCGGGRVVRERTREPVKEQGGGKDGFSPMNGENGMTKDSMFCMYNYLGCHWPNWVILEQSRT